MKMMMMMMMMMMVIVMMRRRRKGFERNYPIIFRSRTVENLSWYNWCCS
jgi:hypothetical protein